MLNNLFEANAWQELIHSSEWRVFIKLLESHKQYLQQEVNKCLRNHEDRRAGEALRAMDDCNKILQLVKDRIDQLNKEKENGRKE